MTRLGHGVSIVIPTRDRPMQLSRLLASIAHSPNGAEIVVVDDGSQPPVTLADKNVRVVRNVQPRFLAAARNIGAARSSGDVLVFVDDDCVLDPNALASLVDLITSDPSVGIAGPVIAYLDAPEIIWCAGSEHGEWTGLTRLRAHGAHLTRAKRIRPDCDDFPCAFAIRRRVFDEVGGFDEDLSFHMTEGDIAQRVSSHGYRVTLAADAIVWHDFSFPPNAPLRRRLMSPPNPERAYVVGYDRVRFIRRQHVATIRRMTQLCFYLLILVPAYSIAILVDSGRPMAMRLRATRSFLSGNWTGLVRSAQPRR